MGIGLQTVRVTGVTRHTPNIVSINLAPVGSDCLSAFDPGAHIDVHLPNGLVRSYSLMTSLTDSGHYRLGVLHDRQSRGGSAFIHKYLRTGVVLKVSLPRNNFPVSSARQAVFIAGGIGITPLLGMARQLAERGAAVGLLYCVRSEEEMAFRDELDALSADVSYHIDDRQGGAPDLLSFMQGYPADTHFYCCGPAPMLNAFDRACSSLGIRHSHTERFSGAAPPPPDAISKGYQVVLSRSGAQLYHDGKGSLLDVLIASGHTLSYSCKEGVCGACEVRVLEGALEHRDVVLSAAERASGRTMMICVSGCTSERLVLDI
ncbi:PDR/VanB family oxidoreductase [Pseudomonas syringae]|uniref:2Fe-2S iron-sulfur cluster binding domain-containing protein n=4 Tax=Pseudomonas syringae TaxID=317 RepID=A0A9Q4A6J7_PSESX|nr:PDR/VanB family oxidoreductase [Pseudomonas syringae]KTB88178.1 ferredoxin [Pseudomonas syringae pv. syringae PD2766]MCF5469991.1 2Fe-2S iron-sulfur cluster binding domain-containing protein [Pseudomonas syringae]MCF5471830.1 2Fe-2S iron-sulfur cluster binding domain-containing protein [Pseudomonas syringae]MCF5482807.1 2Fe-2S iron-sulfur cluster binding domain-containing protein [Pseudomonas syringae]MCF5490423.1 2Fe-2S iron-sulfur cluster binding domain-containing protein [Pseudomonas syr